MLKKIIGIYLPLLVIINSNALATTLNPFYISGDVGYAVSKDKIKVSEIENIYDDNGQIFVNDGAELLNKKNKGVGFKFALGYRLNPNIRVEGQFYSDSNQRSKRNIVDSDNSNDVNYYSSKVKTSAFFANIYYDFKDFNKFTPYILAGVGIAKTKHNFRLDERINGITADSDNINFPKKSKAAFQLGLGTLYKLTNNLDLNLGYNLMFLGKNKSTVMRSIDDPDIFLVYKNKTSNINHLLTIGLKINF